MTLTDLMNHHYANAVREAMIDLTLGWFDHEVKIGDIVEMLLSTSFAVKDAMVAWEWHRRERMATSEIGLGDASDRTSGICEQYGSIISRLGSNSPGTLTITLEVDITHGRILMAV